MSTLTADISPDKSALASAVARARFVVQHTWPSHFEVVSSDPAANGKSADGIDYTDFAEAASVRDRLNLAAS
jgi:hypothetical protein